MATERQIQANRQNASRSSGPRSDLGKSRSRLNAVKHGMAGESAEVEAMASTEFLERREKWAEEFAPVGEGGEWALDRAVAASLRIERCERAIDEIQVAGSERARLAWDQDRAVEAAIVFNRLGRDPVLASRQLQTTFAGVVLLIEAWFGLAATLQVGDWSEAEVSRALDLLGVSPDGRSGLTPVDDPEGGDAAAFRRLLTFEEIERLESLRDEVMAPLEDLEQRQAIAGNMALLSKPAKLVLRYERDAWHRYRESMKQVKGPAKVELPEAERAGGSRCRFCGWKSLRSESRGGPEKRPRLIPGRPFEEPRGVAGAGGADPGDARGSVRGTRPGRRVGLARRTGEAARRRRRSGNGTNPICRRAAGSVSGVKTFVGWRSRNPEGCRVGLALLPFYEP